MNPIVRERLFGWQHAFDAPAVMWVVGALGGLLAVAGLMIAGFTLSGRVRPEMRRELVTRYVTWLVMIAVVVLPILAGAAWTIVLFTILSLWCFVEFAQVTGFAAERRLCAVIVAAILLINFACLDNWYGFFAALMPLSMVSLAALAVSMDQPAGFIRRLGVATLCVLLFGICLGHLSFLANASDYRAPLLLLLIAVGLNDVYAFCVGKTLGRRKLAPHTSPNKTWDGAIGALMLTTLTFALLGRQVFAGTPLVAWRHLITLGALVSIAGQFGDLTLSSVKRDLGVKDTGHILPGHGGILDRCNSLLLSAPVLFHYLHYVVGVGLDQPARIFTTG